MNIEPRPHYPQAYREMLFEKAQSALTLIPGDDRKLTAWEQIALSKTLRLRKIKHRREKAQQKRRIK